MTENSFPWECTDVGDGDAVTVNDFVNRNAILGSADPINDGVVYWTDATAMRGFANASDGLLAPSNPAGDTIRIAPGIGLVNGWVYINDANVDFDVSGGNASATDLIVLRRGAPSVVSSVRLALVRGAAASTATVTQTTTTWEVAIAQVTLDGAGNFSSLTDVRSLCVSPNQTMIKIAETIADGASGTITFDNIPGLFTHLLVVGTGRSDDAGGTDDITMTFNNDGGGNYDSERIVDAGAPATSTAATSFIYVGTVTGAGGTANFADGTTIDIFNYTNTGFYKTFIGMSMSYGSAAPDLIETRGWWRSLVALARLDLILTNGNFVSGSTYSLYGIV